MKTQLNVCFQYSAPAVSYTTQTVTAAPVAVAAAPVVSSVSFILPELEALILGSSS